MRRALVSLHNSCLYFVYRNWSVYEEEKKNEINLTTNATAAQKQETPLHTLIEAHID